MGQDITVGAVSRERQIGEGTKKGMNGAGKHGGQGKGGLENCPQMFSHLLREGEMQVEWSGWVGVSEQVM